MGNTDQISSPGLLEGTTSTSARWVSREQPRNQGAQTRGPLILRLSRATFSVPVLLGILLVAGVFAAAKWNIQHVSNLPADLSAMPVMAGDSWLHLVVGRTILATHAWPVKDAFTFTASGSPSLANEWLGDVVIAKAFQADGLHGLAVLIMAMAGALILLMYIYAYTYAGSFRASFVACALAIPVIAGRHLGPQLFGYAFLAITLIALERFRQGRGRMLWILPPVFLLWVNTHSTFVLGLLALAVYWASGLRPLRAGGLEGKLWTLQERLQLEWVGLFSIIALCVTPYGTRLAAAPLGSLVYSPHAVAQSLGNLPLSAYGPMLKPFMLLLLLFILAQMLFGPRYRLEQIGLLVFATCLAATHARYLVVFAIIMAPLLAELLARWLPPQPESREPRMLIGSLVAITCLGIVMSVPSRSDLDSALNRAFPVGAAKYLREHPAIGHLLNESNWGSYLTWTLGPEFKVFIDGRSELYESAGVLGDYFRITHLDPDTLPLLRKYDIDACLLPVDAPLATLLESQPQWRRAYVDNLSALFVYAGTDDSVGRVVAGASRSSEP